MSRRTLAECTCDLCEAQETVHGRDYPVGWQDLTLVTAGKKTRPTLLCPTCAELLEGWVKQVRLGTVLNLQIEVRVPNGKWYPFRTFVKQFHVPGNEGSDTDE